jgi:uncharacterized LabA/DUF88 family protein
MRRACVFVDGENFRHSLKHLFPSGRYSFGKGDYLPETDWHAFFTSLADGFDCELLRVYWYERDLEEARVAIERRARGWREIQASIESHNDQLEFRRSGSIPYELATKQFGVEKGVDTQLATDMIVLSDIYDAAIILSGDADYLPPVAAVKNKGKFVYCVSFLDRKGKQLPGGARRLSNAVDSRADLHFELVRRAMRIEEVLAEMAIAV